MTAEELQVLVSSQEALGLSTLVLSMPAPQSWTKSMRHPLSVRTPFGLCRWYPASSRYPDQLMIYVPVEKAKRWLKKAMG